MELGIATHLCISDSYLIYFCLSAAFVSAVNPYICFIFSENYHNGLRQYFHCNCLSRRISGLQGNNQMQTMTSSYGDSSLQTHSSSVHITSYSRKA